MSIWNFDATNLEDVKSPFAIVSDLCKELHFISKGRVLARVTEYSGKYKSTEGLSYGQVFTASLPFINNVPGFNVQDVMGDNAADDDFCNEFVYELYITSNNTPKYKYRVLIMYYGINMYPVGLTIQKDIAEEVKLESEGMQFKNESEFTAALKMILGSDTLGNILRNLLTLNP